MPAYEYKVMLAPNRGVKAKGVKGTSARFAHGLELLMNEAADEGWEYLRADVLPCEERQGLRGRVEVDQHVLVFRREIVSEVAEADERVAGVVAGEGYVGRREPRLSATGKASALRLGPAIEVPEGKTGGDADKALNTID